MENMENMENMEMFSGSPTEITLLTAFIATVKKIITYALGEHDPGSAQDWRTSHDFCSPVCCMYCFKGNGISAVVEQETERFSSFSWLPSIISNNSFSISFALKCLAFGEQDKAKVFNGRFRRAYKSESA